MFGPPVMEEDKTFIPSLRFTYRLCEFLLWLMCSVWSRLLLLETSRTELLFHANLS